MPQLVYRYRAAYSCNLMLTGLIRIGRAAKLWWFLIIIAHADSDAVRV
jgi:hypothetical protein